MLGKVILLVLMNGHGALTQSYVLDNIAQCENLAREFGKFGKSENVRITTRCIEIK